jgi:hypothetical protein
MRLMLLKIKNIFANGVIYWCLAAVALFILLFLAWSRQPIYTDEATYFRLVAYIYQNDWYRPAIYQVCNQFPKYEVAMVFWPAAYIFSLVADLGSYNGLRYFSLSFFLIITIFYFIKLARSAISPELILGLMLAMYSGVLPSTVSIFRPELFIIATFIFLMMASLFNVSKVAIYINLFLATLTYSMTLLLHAKSLLLLPVFVAVLIYVYIKDKKICYIFSPVVLVISYFGFLMNSAQLISCPLAPEFDKVLQTWSVNPTLLLVEPFRFIKEILGVLSSTDFNDIFWKMYYRQHYDYGMLPSMHTAPFAGFCNFLQTVVLSSVFVFVIRQGIDSIRILFSASEGRSGAALFLVSLSTILFFAFINRVGAWYDKGFWIALFLVIAPCVAFNSNKFASSSKLFLSLSALCFLISIGIDIIYMRPILKNEYGTQGIILSSHIQRIKDYKDVMMDCEIVSDEGGLVTDDEPVFLTGKSRDVHSFHYITQPLGLERGLSWIISNNKRAIVGRCDQLEHSIINSSLSNQFAVYKVNRACCFRVEPK